MARRVHAEGLRERRNQREATRNPKPCASHKLVAKRPHPTIGGTIIEIWARGSREEMEELLSDRWEETGDEYELEVQEN